MKKLRAAVVGLGMGRGHARAFAASERAELVAACDKDPARLERIADLDVGATYADFDEMLKKEELEVVVVALPNFLHAPFTMKALAAGAHVLVEKPMAMNADECRRMLDEAEKNKKLLCVGFSYRYTAPAHFLKSLADDGKLGEVYFARTMWHRRRGIPGGKGGWFGQKELAGGGPLIDLGVHRIDLAWWLMGRPEPVSANGAAYCKFGKEFAQKRGWEFTTEDMAAGMIRFENGAVLLVEASWASNCMGREMMRTELFGTSGGAVHENVGDTYEFRARAVVDMGGSQAEVVPSGRDGSGLPKSPVEDILGALAEKKELVSPGEDGLQVQRMLDGLYRSAEEGKEVKV